MLDVNEYIGIQYKINGRTREGCDCWGLVHLILNERFNRNIMDLVPNYIENSFTTVTALFNYSLPQYKLDKLIEPIEGCIVLFAKNGFCFHVGLMIDQFSFIHAWNKHDVAIAKLDHPFWSKRIEGFYYVS